MENYDSVNIATVGEKNLTLKDLIFHLKTDLNQNVLGATVEEEVLRRTAAQLGITITDQDLQKAADEFRRKEGLLSARETHEWLREHGMSVEDMERKIEDGLLRERLVTAVITEDKVMKVFTENITDFQRVKAGVIIADKEGTAREVVSQLEEGEADFVQLALRHSIADNVQMNGGFYGRAHRKDFPPAVEAKVFDENAPELIGPVQAGGKYYVIKLYEKMKSDLDDTARAICEHKIFDEFLQEKALEAGTKFHVLPPPPAE